jgi:hypothetical protein
LGISVKFESERYLKDGKVDSANGKGEINYKVDLKEKGALD